MLYYCILSFVSDETPARRLAMLETVTNPELKTGVRYASPHVIGDRRQEVVFIGQNLEPEQTREILDHCLLSDGEMAAGPTGWKALDDPFPRWFAERNED